MMMMMMNYESFYYSCSQAYNYLTRDDRPISTKRYFVSIMIKLGGGLLQKIGECINFPCKLKIAYTGTLI